MGHYYPNNARNSSGLYTSTITNHGKEVFALLRWDTYESIAETLEIISDLALYDELKIGIKQFENNSLVDFEDFKKSFDV